MRIALVDHHAIAAQLRLDDLDLARHHRVGAEDQVLHRNVFFQRVTPAVEGALAQAAQVQDGFAKGLAGNGAGVYANAADGALALDNGDFLAQLRRADGRLLSCRPAADDDQVVDVIRAGFGGGHVYAPDVRKKLNVTPNRRGREAPDRSNRSNTAGIHRRFTFIATRRMPPSSS